uniref:Uncharacterized protein n=1 Tax=Anguilla anguilla TaxID=7936 RepID=A0A0E9TZU6_ANGAN
MFLSRGTYTTFTQQHNFYKAIPPSRYWSYENRCHNATGFRYPTLFMTQIAT